MNRILESYFYVSPFASLMSDGREITWTNAPLGSASFAGAKKFQSEAEAMEYADWLFAQKDILAKHNHTGVKVSAVTRGFYPRKRTPESEAKVLAVLHP